MTKRRQAAIEATVEKWLRTLPADKSDDRTPAYDEMMQERLNRGVAAVEAGSGEYADSVEPPEQNLVDTLANLMHWADWHTANGLAIDFEDAIRKATNHYEAERDGEL
jgi:hypothetical protein